MLERLSFSTVVGAKGQRLSVMGQKINQIGLE